MTASNPIVVVAGFASGIGARTSDVLRSAGYSVLGVDLITRPSGDEWSAVQGDAAEPETWRQAAEQVTDADSPLHGLVLCLGLQKHVGLSVKDLSVWDLVIRVNLTSAFVALSSLSELISDGGSVVLLSSALAFKGGVGELAYGAAKAGLLGFMRSAAVELAPRGIRVNAIAPGPIDTPMLRSRWPDVGVPAMGTALGRLGTSYEVASLIEYLLAPGSAYITGATIPIDGGRTIV